MMITRIKSQLTRIATACGILVFAQVCAAQNFERYRPQSIELSPPPSKVPKGDLPPIEGSDRVLVESLDAVIVLDDPGKVDPDNAYEEVMGIGYDFDAPGSLVRSEGFRCIIDKYLGGAVTLRRLNALSRDVIQYYHKMGQPVVDVVIPEQRVTAGSVQIVVIESRIGCVEVKNGCYFDGCDLNRWVSCTRSGSRIYESALVNDLFWLNQNPFRRVDVDLRPGSVAGTTDVVFEVDDVKPWNAYLGYDDTGVPSLMLERLFGGVIWGNAFGRGGSLSYQYTADADFRHLHAHAVSYLEPLSRKWSFQTYGSWAAVDPIPVVAVTQPGESWQAGLGLIRHLKKSRCVDTSLSFGFDFKSTNNNLEFGGVNVFASEADLVQLRMGLRSVRHFSQDEYRLCSVDTFVGPGSGFTSQHNRAAFNTIRPDTTTDYIYSRARFERSWIGQRGMQLVGRAIGQISSERLLFSETLGFGGYDSIRGYDQRAFSGDHGWITNLELGPRPWRWCGRGHRQSLRAYALFDVGQALIEDPQPTEVRDEVLYSAGAGLRWSLGDRTNLRVDYAYGFEDSAFFNEGGRVHIGLVSIFGPRP